jgi:hypothetical protein
VRDTDELSAGDKTQILGGTIKRLLNWNRPAESA